MLGISFTPPTSALNDRAVQGLLAVLSAGDVQVLRAARPRRPRVTVLNDIIIIEDI
jgi:hypothetical protein